jgi:transcriptional regulator with XRE-family HTH domain
MKKKQYASTSTKQSLKMVEKMTGGPMTFGAALKANRLSEEMSQEDVGEKIGVSRQYIHQLEVGDRSPSVEQAIKLAKVFGMIEDQFVELALQNQVEKAGIKKKVVTLKKLG